MNRQAREHGYFGLFAQERQQGHGSQGLSGAGGLVPSSLAGCIGILLEPWHGCGFFGEYG